MIPKIQSSFSNARFQTKNNKLQQQTYMSKANNKADSVSFRGIQTCFEREPLKNEIMTEATTKVLKVVAESLAEKKKLLLEAFANQMELFEKQKEHELGIKMNLPKNLSETDTIVSLKEKDVDGSDVNFYSDINKISKFSDYSIFSVKNKNESFSQRIYIKGQEIGVFDNSCRDESLNEEVQKLLKLFLPKEGM